MMTLRGSLTGAVALAALMSTAQAADMRPVTKAPPAAAAPQASGYVEVYGGWANTEIESCGVRDCRSFDADGWALGGAGRANYWINRGMSVQVDAQAEGTSYDITLAGRDFRTSSHSYLVGGHLSWRNPQQHLFGLFAAAGDAGGFGIVPSQRHALFGAEAQLYWNQFTVYVQGGYDTTVGNFGNLDSINAWFVRGTGRYFINPNFMIEGTAMFASGDIERIVGTSLGFDTWLWQAKAEWRLAASPFSLFAKYQGSRTEYDVSSGSLETTDNRVLLGLRLNMGDQSLQATDRAGATLDIISPVANPTGALRFDRP